MRQLVKRKIAFMLLHFCDFNVIIALVINMNVGKRIKARRKELGISADSLAEILGVSRATVFRYENGDIEKLPADILGPVAEALHTTPAYLMGWEDDAPPPPDDILDKTLRRLLARATDEDKQMLIALLERMQEK